MAAEAVSGRPQVRGAGPAEAASWVGIAELRLLLELCSLTRPLPASCCPQWPVPGGRPHRSRLESGQLNTSFSRAPSVAGVCARVRAREEGGSRVVWPSVRLPRLSVPLPSACASANDDSVVTV